MLTEECEEEEAEEEELVQAVEPQVQTSAADSDSVATKFQMKGDAMDDASSMPARLAQTWSSRDVSLDPKLHQGVAKVARSVNDRLNEFPLSTITSCTFCQMNSITIPRSWRASILRTTLQPLLVTSNDHRNVATLEVNSEGKAVD